MYIFVGNNEYFVVQRLYELIDQAGAETMNSRTSPIPVEHIKLKATYNIKQLLPNGSL